MVRSFIPTRKGATHSTVLEHLLIVQWVVGSIPHGGPTETCFVSNWYYTSDVKKGCDLYYPVYERMHLKEPLLLIRKSIPCSGGSGLPLSLSEWFLTTQIAREENPLLPYGLFFPISSKKHNPTDRITNTTAFCYTSHGALAEMKI